MLSFDTGKEFMTPEQIFLSGKELKKSFNLGNYKLHSILKDGVEYSYIQKGSEFFKLDLPSLSTVTFVSAKTTDTYMYGKNAIILSFVVNNALFVTVVHNGKNIYIDSVKEILGFGDNVNLPTPSPSGLSNISSTTAPSGSGSASGLSNISNTTAPESVITYTTENNDDYSWLLYSLGAFVVAVVIILIISKQQYVQSAINKFMKRDKKNKEESTTSSEIIPTSPASPSPTSEDS